MRRKSGLTFEEQAFALISGSERFDITGKLLGVLSTGRCTSKLNCFYRNNFHQTNFITHFYTL